MGSRDLRLSDTTHVRTLAVTGYPREVRLGWLEPLLTHPGHIDVSLHVDPISTTLATDRLRRQRARLESARHIDVERGRISDPQLDLAVEDAAELAERIARGDGRLFRVSLYVTVRGRTPDELAREYSRVRTLLASLLFDAHPTTFRALQGWVSTLPCGVDAVGLPRTMDTAAVAASFPFASAELSASQGVVYGRNARGGGLVLCDRFSRQNYNEVVLACSGAGKSYLAKLDALRSLYQGVEVAVIDPEDEYRRLAEAVGGTYLHLGRAGVRLNPFDLDGDSHLGADALAHRGMSIHTLVAVLLDEPLSAAARAALDAAIIATYQAAGITTDPRTHARPAPLLGDLIRVLEAGDEVGQQLAGRLAPFAHGTHRTLFDGPTTTRPDGHLVVFSLRDLSDELKAAGTLLTLDSIWRRITDPSRRRRRIVVVDEAWLLMRDRAGAAFLNRLAKSARKHWAGLTIVTQDAADLLGSDLGQAVVANAATQVLLRQAPQAIDALTQAFGLSEGERHYLLGAARGEGILMAGADRAAFRTLASEAEHHLVTSDPAELADAA